jgi:hypothetical protein
MSHSEIIISSFMIYGIIGYFISFVFYMSTRNTELKLKYPVGSFLLSAFIWPITIYLFFRALKRGKEAKETK